MGFGTQVKKARAEKQLTLQELSERSGVSRSMLSKIEREEKNPTIQIACQVAEGLGLSLSRLLDEQEEREVMLIKKQERLIFRDEQSGFERHLLSPSFPTRGMEFIYCVIPPAQTSGTFPPHAKGVKEYVTVAQGLLQVSLGERVFLLEAGDSLYYDANIEHQFANVGSGECQYYLVIDSYLTKA